MAELAAPAAPGVTMLRQGPFSLLQTEGVERITADLAKNQLGGVSNDRQYEAGQPDDPWLRGQGQGQERQNGDLEARTVLVFCFCFLFFKEKKKKKAKHQPHGDLC